MNYLKQIINEEIERTLNEERLSRIINEEFDRLLFEKKKKSKKKKGKKHKKSKAKEGAGTGTDTIERSNRKAYNNDLINGSELGRKSGIGNPNWSDDTLRSYISKLYGKGNHNPRKASKKENKKMHSQVAKI